MPRRQQPRKRPVTRSDETRRAAASASTSPDRLTPQQVARWAELIAEGHGDFPVDLAPPERDWLLVEVRSHLRDRLVHHIARAIAASVHSEAGFRSETDFHAKS